MGMTNYGLHKIDPRCIRLILCVPQFHSSGTVSLEPHVALALYIELSFEASRSSMEALYIPKIKMTIQFLGTWQSERPHADFFVTA